MSSRDDIISQVELESESVHWDLENRTHYGSYLHLEKMLSAQIPRSSEHDEMMFIVVHQVSELWLKLILHEVTGVIAAVKSDTLGPAFKMLSRVSRIQTQLIEVWSVLSTMTPVDYAAFRSQLGEASGFQSYQYRITEFTLGNKNAKLGRVHEHDPEIMARVDLALTSPSLYDEVLALLSRRGLPVPSDKLDRDWSQPYIADEAVEAAWAQVYGDPVKLWDLYELAEKLIDIEDNFQQWRFRHMKTVSRIIGMKSGTGGTAGVSYLKKALSLRFFPELWSLRTQI